MHKLLVALGGYLLLSVSGGVFLSESSLKLRRLPLRHAHEFATIAREKYGAELQDASIHAADGAEMKGWYVHPSKFNGNAVVLMHGITDNREGVAGYGIVFLDHGYAVLLPDARGHGESGGEIATYGVKDAADLHRWVSWIYAKEGSSVGCIYGFGESYGAALILESLEIETRYCAVVVESPFSTARAMSYERVSRPLHMGPWFGKTLGQPIIESAAIYSRLRYDIDLLKPSPLDAVKHSSVPVLLIHGTKDGNISPLHSEVIARAAPDRVQLWLVPGAIHTGAWTAAHDEFESRMLGWFRSHHSLPLAK